MENGTEREGLQRMMETYGTSLLRMCAVYLRDINLAQDAVQDTFLKAYRSLPTFRGECSEKTWLIRIAVHTCRDYQRSAWFRRIDRRKCPEDLQEGTIEQEFPDHTVLNEVSRLPKRSREVILLRYYQGMKIGETAEALSVSISTVKQRCRQANAILREKLKGWYYGEE